MPLDAGFSIISMTLMLPGRARQRLIIGDKSAILFIADAGAYAK